LWKPLRIDAAQPRRNGYSEESRNHHFAAAQHAHFHGNSSEEYLVPAYQRHVFVCHNTRPADAPRPSCTTDGKSELFTQLQNFSKAAGLGATVRINKSGCLDQCEHGPVMVVYPDAVWYGHVQPSDAAEIVQEHLVNGRPVERLRLAEECINTKSCPHRG
jgi:(2Fe-2S) ferredoxin